MPVPNRKSTDGILNFLDAWSNKYDRITRNDTPISTRYGSNFNITSISKITAYMQDRKKYDKYFDLF
ncbi:hypothetical protein OAQ99_05630 [Candidatus Kapabacteria bacterium]|nr:hypothetical protein [Candidatus Kapabacteria bacterium]